MDFDQWLAQVREALASINMPLDTWQERFPFNFRKAFDEGVSADDAAAQANKHFWSEQDKALATVPNLDAVNEPSELDRILPTLTAQRCFPHRPQGFREAIVLLNNYAQNKRLAMQYRLMGDINKALAREQQCDAIYQKLPAYARW